MIARVFSAQPSVLGGDIVTIETDLSRGLFAFAMVGLAVLAGYFTKNLTDDFFFRPNSLVFWAIAGMLLGVAARLPRKR